MRAKPGDVPGQVLLEVFSRRLPETGAKDAVKLRVAAETCIERRAEQIAALGVDTPKEPRET